ncbi:MAG: AAA family ATPase [Polyangia bacterium]|jgi:chromosome segregation protein|nr:AAA family ATPase [Polyangia bacterium]
MRIKKIDMVGFKSFCDKTSLLFNDNLTAIVGPNGCGKSNVVDAMRWVMGSKSAKQLRGASMEDVIFAGTEARGPLGMAEVTFTLDLSDGVAPPQYQGYREVEVTRRLYRDGTSDYFIQKIPARLQDIRDLFLGTGVGHYAYAIIEQGRVTEMVSSKPETRRQFIEEAAGITKYKEKKHKAELKMASTRQNLLRIGDIVAELDASLRRLWRAARRAERFEAYRDEVADLDKWRISQLLLENLNGRRVATKALQDLTAGVSHVDASIAEKEAKLAAERLELRGLEVALSDRQAALAALDNQVKLLEAQVDHGKREVEQLDRRSTLDAAEAERLEEAISRYEREISETGETLRSLEAQFEERQSELVRREEELAQARDAQADADERVEEHRSRSSRADTRIATLEADARSASQRAEEASGRLDALALERESLGERTIALEPQVTELASRIEAGRVVIEERAAQRAGKAVRLKELQEVIGRLEVELDTVRGQLHRTRSRKGSLEEIQRRYEGFQQGTRAIMEHASEVAPAQAIRGLLADVVEAPAEYEAAVEAVLGERLGAILVSDQQVSLGAVRYLKREQLGRSCFLAVEAHQEAAARSTDVVAAHGEGWGGAALAGSMEPGLGASRGGFESASDSEIKDPAVRGRILDLVKVRSQYKDLAGRLLGDALVVSNLEDALRIWRRAPRTVVTLDGEVVDSLGLVSGGSPDTAGAGILAQKREIRELGELGRELGEQHDELLERLLGAKQEARSLELELEELALEVHKAQMSLLADQKDLESASSQLEECRRRLSSSEAEAARLESLLGDLESKQREWRAELGQLRREQSAVEEQLSLGLSAAEAERGKVERLSSETAELKVGVVRALEQRGTCERDLARLRQDLQSSSERLVTLIESAAEGRVRVASLMEEIGKWEEERLLRASEAMDLNGQVSAEAEACEVQRLTLDEFEAGLKTLREERKSQGEEREGLRLRLTELDKDWGYLEERLAERHHASAEEILHDYHLRPLFGEELSERLDRQQKVLESMRSTYHPGARQEYEELSERHAFLSEQKQDLEDALDRLEKAIQKINKTSRARFREAFDGINVEFQAVFPRLFKGGKARLELAQTGDILATGVEIIAQPPGKKLQSVEVMSGGEKALTAVALLFAIFRYKPSPFCLLDEVDAPLDDVNVDRFNEMVREMAADTQFVMITHNKRTMAMSDALYGVTMEQPGCSKVVAVNFKEASRLADEPPRGPGPAGPSPAIETRGGASGLASGSAAN